MQRNKTPAGRRFGQVAMPGLLTAKPAGDIFVPPSEVILKIPPGIALQMCAYSFPDSALYWF